jgi:hypothetical protein
MVFKVMEERKLTSINHTIVLSEKGCTLKIPKHKSRLFTQNVKKWNVWYWYLNG